MKSPLKKFRGFLQSKIEPKEKKDNRRPPAKLEELVQATQDMLDMRCCYESLLSAAAVTLNSAHEFSEALKEMGTCLLENTALNDDEESGRVLLMLGKVQFELQKLVDGYRAHVSQTITSPTNSLLKELQVVEEMKCECDDKRDSYKFMLAAHRDKGKSKHAKGGKFSSQQLREAHDEYEEEANKFVFRMESLKQGQSRSLLTQAARHHAAQLNFFRKGLKSLDSVEPHVKVVADREHIDYRFTVFEDDDTEDDDSYGFDSDEDGEMSFDYGDNDYVQDVLSLSRKSMELDQVNQPIPQASPLEPAKEKVSKSHTELLSQSAPLFPHKKFDSSESTPSSTQKLYSYALPTPVDTVSSNFTGSVHQREPTPRMERRGGLPTQLSHSSPLYPNAQSTVLKESNITRAKQSSPHQNVFTHPESKKIKLQASSSPLTSTHWSYKSNLLRASSGPLTSRYWSTKPSSSTNDYRRSVHASHASTPILMSTQPKISELHELPRPPGASTLVAHSAPLVYRGTERHKMGKKSLTTPNTASLLPTPPAAVHRSFTTPSRSERMQMSPVAKLLESSRSSCMSEEVASPPLTPITLTDTRGFLPSSGICTY